MICDCVLHGCLLVLCHVCCACVIACLLWLGCVGLWLVHVWLMLGALLGHVCNVCLLSCAVLRVCGVPLVL